MAQALPVLAKFLGARIEIRDLDQTRALAHAPLTLSLGPERWAVVFRFGVIVLFGLNSAEELETLDRLGGFVSGKFAAPETETAEMLIDPAERDHVNAEGQLVIQDRSVERLQIMAHALAKSVVLAYYEKSVASNFERFEKLIEQLRLGLSPKQGGDVLNEVGQALAILSRTVGKVEVTEKPELTWDNPALDRLYQRLALEYELHDRDLILSRKLDLLWRIAETYLDLLNHRQGHRLEWYIVILIVIEIALTLAEKFHLIA